MLAVAIYIKDTYTSEYNRVDLFNDEKISVVSSIQNINDISKTYTDFSQTFTVPASKQNNKIFRHWYDNSNDNPFSTLVKSDAYIEIDTIPFRKGKIQLESANLEDGLAKDYSITFIGILGNLKDTFNGKYLKDLTSTAYDFTYVFSEVLAKIQTNSTSSDIMYPLISPIRNWNYGKGGVNDITIPQYGVEYEYLFPAIKLRLMLNLIETEFGINFDGTIDEPSNFLNTDARFTNAYLYLKNADNFDYESKYEYQVFKFQTQTGFPPSGTFAQYQWQSYDFATGRFTSPNQNTTSVYNTVTFRHRSTGGGQFTFQLWNVTNNVLVYENFSSTSPSSTQEYEMLNAYLSDYMNITFEVRIIVTSGTVIFTSGFSDIKLMWFFGSNSGTQILDTNINQTFLQPKVKIREWVPEIKIEDFFSGILKMFNLTCYSNDGINYTVEQLENYYNAGSDVDITKYVIQDKKNLNRVKTYKRINFEYEKSESFVNVAFNSKNGIEYGSLYYQNNPTSDGEEYNIKLPFEDLNFQNLKDKLQVGYTLKSDTITQYIPKPIILYDYNPTALTTLVGTSFYLGQSTSFPNACTTYKSFGQETLISGNTYGLNFPTQQSTLTNLPIEKGLYNQYYEKYFVNIFNVKARLIKVSAILPTSILTSLKLNDNILIRDTKYLINTFTTDLTTGEVQFELLTDQRQ